MGLGTAASETGGAAGLVLSAALQSVETGGTASGEVTAFPAGVRTARSAEQFCQGWLAKRVRSFGNDRIVPEGGRLVDLLQLYGDAERNRFGDIT